MGETPNRADPAAGQAEEHAVAARRQAEHGAEAYGGDTDAEPSVTEAEVKAGVTRDEPEG